MKQVDTLLLGGGISSISYVHFAEPIDYLIIEKENKLGGLCRSFKVGDSTFDFSGHFMHFKDETMRAYVEKLVNKHTPGELKEYDRLASIAMFKDGKIDKDIDYPFQANIHQLDKEDFIKCLVGLWEASNDFSFDRPANFEVMVRGLFGDGITDMFFKPYNEKMYCAKLTDMSSEAMKRFLPNVDFSDVMKNVKQSTQQTFGYNAKFLYLPETGIQGLVDSFVAEKDITNYQLGVEVTNIDLENKTVECTAEDGSTQTIKYNKLINTLPLNAFLDLAGLTIPDSFKSMDVHIFNLTYEGDVSNIKNRCWTYFPDSSVPFYRVGFYNFMSGKEDTSLYVEVSTPHGDACEETVESIDAHLRRSGVISEAAKLVDTQELSISPAYVIISDESIQTVNENLASLAEQSVYSLGRYGRWTYQSIEDNILDAKELVIKLK